MYPISTCDGQNLDLDDLSCLVKRICVEHQSSKRALAFAFILYDFTNENISKILVDEEYWLSLNKLSGDLLTIFYINTKKASIKAQTKRIRYRQSPPASSLHSSCWMTGISYGNDPEIFNGMIKELFGIDNDINLPAILFFQVENENITDFLITELRKNEIEKSFLEMKGHIKCAVDSLKQIDSRYHRNTTQIFDVLKTALNNRTQRTFMGRVAKLLPFGKFLTLFINEI